MVIFRSLRRTLTDEIRLKNRTFFTATSNSTLTPSSPFATFHPLHYYSPPFPPPRFLSPLCKWIAPFRGQGPLFLISPPWKLLQSATPLYLRGNGVVLRKVEALHLNLLKNRIRSGQQVLDTVHEFKVDASDASSAAVDDEVFKSFVNLPNFISMTRLVSGPLLGWMITNEMYSSAFVGLAISGATDWLDGYVARKMKINSVVGSYLDPLADKVLIGSVALAMVHIDLLHPGLVGMVVLRDVALVGGALYHRANSLNWKWNSWYDFINLDGTKPEKVEPLFISKVNTVFQLLLVAAALLQPEFGTVETQPYITYLSWLVAGTTVASIAGYGARYMRNRPALLARKS